MEKRVKEDHARQEEELREASDSDISDIPRVGGLVLMCPMTPYAHDVHDLFAKDWSLMSFCFVSYTFSLSGANWSICIHILDKHASSQDITLHCISDMQSVLEDLLWSMFMTHTQRQTFTDVNKSPTNWLTHWLTDWLTEHLTNHLETVQQSCWCISVDFAPTICFSLLYIYIAWRKGIAIFFNNGKNFT